MGFLYNHARRLSFNGRSPEEAGHYVRALQALLRSVGSSDGNMEQVRHCGPQTP